MVNMKRITRVDNVFVSADFYDESGNLIGYSVLGISSGEDFYGVNGETGYSVDSALGNGQNVTVNVTLQGDADGLFNVVQSKNNQYKKINGHSAF